jgi:hypothetical protein
MQKILVILQLYWNSITLVLIWKVLRQAFRWYHYFWNPSTFEIVISQFSQNTFSSQTPTLFLWLAHLPMTYVWVWYSVAAHYSSGEPSHATRMILESQKLKQWPSLSEGNDVYVPHPSIHRNLNRPPSLFLWGHTFASAGGQKALQCILQLCKCPPADAHVCGAALWKPRWLGIRWIRQG